MVPVHRRQLTIGEYAAATQLTAKALRLYDEQGLIKPRVVDSATGYRYYETDQVATGRLVRALRDMTTFSHRGPKCSCDAFLEEFDLHDPTLDELARIIRAADTGSLHESREAPGLLAISLGLSASIANDQVLLEQAMTIYDALYAWCKTARDETHSWPQVRSQASS